MSTRLQRRARDRSLTPARKPRQRDYLRSTGARNSVQAFAKGTGDTEHNADAMTFVATFAVQDVPAVIGDILISGPERRERATTLPVIGHATPVFPPGSGWWITQCLGAPAIYVWSGALGFSVLKSLTERLFDITHCYGNLDA